MSLKEWTEEMGGDSHCKDKCQNCALTEYGLVQKLGKAQANVVFKKHWQTYFIPRSPDFSRELTDLMTVGSHSKMSMT